ncbi:MAG: HAMP domain-containing protein [Candidatus Cloacimonetes bacterium]|nr:HAMP domain-containing protein [Candidatus Cloacimonadota bacterium]
MKKHSIFLKIILGFIVINIVLVLAVSLISYQIIKNHYLDTLRDYLFDTGNILLINIKPLLLEQRYADLDIYIKELGSKSEFRITVITSEGLVVADSERDISEMDDHSGRPEIITALQGTTGESIRFSSSIQTDMLYVSLPIIERDEVIGVVRVSLFLDKIDILISSLRNEIFLIALIVFIIAFFGLYLFSLRLTKPIKELSKAANKISAGNFDVSVYPRANDDIGYLCRSFNFMVTKIQELITDITQNKDALDTIINTMQEGLLVLNENGKIELTNKSFDLIAESDDLISKYYFEGIRKPELSEFIREMFESQENYYKEIVIDDDYFISNGLSLPNKKDKLVLLFNITDLRKLEKVKKDMIANVSHELRSPLTAIKGFAETLEDEVTPEGKEFLEIIERNINRLINIVNDLLTLSQLEQRDIVELKPIAINDIVNHIAHIYRQKIEKKNMKLQLELANNLPSIKGDEFRIEQLLVNLLENSLQHTEEGFIIIRTYKDDRFIVLEIDDTGVGIPAEHRDRIFERFYVVDKSRSKKYGGTGLGLAIVKHIALLHNGSVALKQKDSKGSCFVVKLPIR